MQKRKRAWKDDSECTFATTIAKKLSPHCGPSLKFELLNIDATTSMMTSSNARQSDDGVQFVDDVIDTTLIDKAVGSVGSVRRTYSTYTELDWTSECEELRLAYRDKIHKSVCPSNTDDFACSNAPARSSVSRR